MLVANGITKLFASRRDAMLVKFTSGIDSNFYQHIVPMGRVFLKDIVSTNILSLRDRQIFIVITLPPKIRNNQLFFCKSQNVQ
jgi:hypothetical protein